MTYTPYAPQGQTHPAGWYPDAQGVTRYWDGQQWTHHTAAAAMQQPVAAPAAAAKPGVLWAAVVSALLLIVGGFGSWATFGSVSVAGTKGGDGWIVIGAGALALAMLALWAARRGRAGAITALIMGLIGVAVGAIDYADISDSILSPAWGIYLVLLGGFALMGTSIGLIARGKR